MDDYSFFGLFSDFDTPFELAEMDDYSFQSPNSSFALKPQILTSQQVIDMISCADKHISQIPLNEDESLFIEKNKNSIVEEVSRSLI